MRILTALAAAAVAFAAFVAGAAMIALPANAADKGSPPPATLDQIISGSNLKGCYIESSIAGTYLRSDRAAIAGIGGGCDAVLANMVIGAGIRANWGDLANTQQRLARVGQAGNGALNAVLAGQAGQNAANATADMAGRAQMSARDRALRALEASAGLAGDVRGQDFGEAAARAKAADAFNLFNADQRTNAQQANNSNAFGSFNAKMGLKDRRNAARGGVVKGYEDSADRTLQTAAGVGQAVQQGAQGAANYGTRQQDIQREDEWRTKRGY